MDDWPSIEQMIEDVIKTDQWTLRRGFLPLWTLTHHPNDVYAQ